MANEKIVETAVNLPENLIKAAFSFLITTVKGCTELAGFSQKFISTIVSIPGAVFGAILSSPLAGVAHHGVHLTKQLTQNAGIKSALRSLVKQGQEAFKSGTEVIANNDRLRPR